MKTQKEGIHKLKLKSGGYAYKVIFRYPKKRKRIHLGIYYSKREAQIAYENYQRSGKTVNYRIHRTETAIPMTTNLERWRYWMQDFCSPQSFIDWGFYSLISISLQRRVYLGSDRKTLCGNMYNILCGPPGVGKGMVLGEVANVLGNPKLQKVPGLNEKKNQMVKELEESELASPNMNKKVSTDNFNNLLIPMAANATTFEALSRAFMKATRAYRIEVQPNIYVPQQHASICFLLEELGSLFRKHTDDIHTLLCETYDCKERYVYDTKHQGNDDIRRPCSNILAGTTPDFLKRVFGNSILTEGFASRAVFVVELKNRFRRYDTPIFCQEQILEHERIVDHVKKLTALQGVVKFTPEALEFNKGWFENDYAVKLPNAHPKLIPYYARINITHAKLAMAMHFADSTTMEIGLPECEAALKELQTREKTMHLALSMENKNPLSEATEGIAKYIQFNGSTSQKQLMVAFYEALPNPTEDVVTILNFLLESGRIAQDEIKPKHWVYVKQ